MKPYEGYTIETGFLVGNLFEDFGDEFGGDIGTYDVSASAERYAGFGVTYEGLKPS